jgi:hypothetical protein
MSEEDTRRANEDLLLESKWLLTSTDVILGRHTVGPDPQGRR